MKIALIGYGKMGKEIEKIALNRNHEISVIIEEGEDEKFSSEAFKNSDVAIEFTNPDNAFNNYKKSFSYNIPIVSGTTGWLDKLPEIKKICKEESKTFFYASNFSLGVNIFFKLNKDLAKIMNDFPQYNVSIEETHHIHKLDKPSGTAVTIADDILSNIDNKKSWSLNSIEPDLLYINSIREGEVNGLHIVKYESDIDTIEIKHDAKNRKGFALGAVVAAEFTANKKGFLTMNDLLKF